MEFFYSNQVYKKLIQVTSMNDNFGSWNLSKFNRLQKINRSTLLLKACCLNAPVANKGRNLKQASAQHQRLMH